MTPPSLRAKNIYLLLIVLAVLVYGVSGFMKGKELMAMRTITNKNETYVASAQKDSGKLQQIYTETEKIVTSDQKNFQRIASQILPEGEQYIELTKMFDDFFDANFQSGSEIIASNLRFGTVTQVPDKPYSVLPLSLTITASREKFEKFLRFVEHSGQFEFSANAATRFLDLQSIRMSFEQGEGKEDIAFIVDLRAFYRNSNGSNKLTPTT